MLIAYRLPKRLTDGSWATVYATETSALPEGRAAVPTAAVELRGHRRENSFPTGGEVPPI